MLQREISIQPFTYQQTLSKLLNAPASDSFDYLGS